MLVTALVAAPATRAGATAPTLHIDFLAVGQGDATLITSPTGKTVLIDAGPPEGAVALVADLRARHIGALDLVLLTHRHADHLGGMRAVIEAVGAKLFIDSTFPHPTPLYADLLRALQAGGVPVRDAVRGRHIDLGGGAAIELLSPPEPPITGTRSDVNANSVVVRLQYGGVAVLLAGDAEAATEKWLLASRARLDARVLKVAHHGSRYSSSLRFLRAVGPEVAVISVGAANVYHHPAPATLARLASVGARVYRTDEDGDISVATDGQRLSIKAARRVAAEEARAWAR